MKFLRTVGVLALSAFVFTACDDATGVEVADLEGNWSATQFEYIDSNVSGFSLDAISDAGGSLTLDVAADGSFTGTLSIPGLTVNPNTGETITLPIGGSFSINGDTLSIDFDSTTEGYGLFGDFDATFTLDGDVLTFTNPATTFDFPDAIEEAAGIGARPAVDVSLEVRLVR